MAVQRFSVCGDISSNNDGSWVKHDDYKKLQVDYINLQHSVDSSNLYLVCFRSKDAKYKKEICIASEVNQFLINLSNSGVDHVEVFKMSPQKLEKKTVFYLPKKI